MRARDRSARWRRSIRLDAVMSDYKADSDLSRLNRAGRAGASARRSEPVRGCGRVPGVFAALWWRVRHHDCAGAEDVAEGDGRRTAAVCRRNCAGAAMCGLRAHRSHCAGSHRFPFGLPRNRSRRHWQGIRGGQGHGDSRSCRDQACAGQCRHELHCRDWCAPGKEGWPVLLGGAGPREQVLLLRDNSVSTSQQGPRGLKTRGHNRLQSHNLSAEAHPARSSTPCEELPRKAACRSASWREVPPRRMPSRPLWWCCRLKRGGHSSRSSRAYLRYGCRPPVRCTRRIGRPDSSERRLADPPCVAA